MFLSKKKKVVFYVSFNFCWQPGITTDEIDEAVHQMIVDNGAYPSPLGYGGFPKSVCTSVNECICHGIPDSRSLEVLPHKSEFVQLLYILVKSCWYILLFAGWWYNQHWCYCLFKCKLYLIFGVMGCLFCFLLGLGGRGLVAFMEFHVLCTLLSGVITFYSA